MVQYIQAYFIFSRDNVNIFPLKDAQELSDSENFRNPSNNVEMVGNGKTDESSPQNLKSDTFESSLENLMFANDLI